MTDELDDKQHDEVVRPNTQSVRDFRWRQRGASAERQAKAEYFKSPRGLLERQWTRQWARISDDEKAAILAQHKIAIDALNEITKVVDGLSTGRQPGIDLPFPDFIYRDFSAVPRSDNFPNIDVAAAMDVEDFDALDDEGFRKYGKVTKLPSVLWSEFCRLTLAWAHTTGDCDADIQTLLENTVITNVRPPEATVSPCSRDSVRVPTTSEERGRLAHQKDINRTRRLLAEAKDVPDA